MVNWVDVRLPATSSNVILLSSSSTATPGGLKKHPTTGSFLAHIRGSECVFGSVSLKYRYLSLRKPVLLPLFDFQIYQCGSLFYWKSPL